MSSKKILVILISVLLLVSVSLMGCSSNTSTAPANNEQNQKQDVKTIRYAHFQPGSLDQPKQAAAVAFKAYVEENTNGSVKVEIFPASQLGDADTVLEGLQMGSIQMGVVHDGPVSSLYEPMGVYNLPYLFNNQGEAWTVFDSEYTKKIAEAMRAETGIRMLALADNGIRHFTNSKREINTVKDMEGLIIRVQPSPLYERLVQGTGASPASIPWTELPAALQQGVVDGQENGVTNILAASLYQSQKYISLGGHVYSYHAYLISDEFFSTLTPDEQKVVQEGVDIAKWIHRGMTANQDMNASQILSEKGMQVTILTPEAIEGFRQKTQPLVAEWMTEQIGAEWVDGLLELVDSLR